MAPLGCATRELNNSVFDRRGVTVYLREYRQGFTLVERDFAHPVTISTERLVNILGAIDVRGREGAFVGVRAAFEPAQLELLADGLAAGLSQASPSQEVAVQSVRKAMQKVIFDRKYLTSFVAYVENDLLYLHISRVDWKIPERETKGKLPMPRVSEHPMKIKVEPSEGMFQEGVHAVSVEWRDPVFRLPRRRVVDEDDRRERVILLEEPERAPKRRSSLPADLLPYLTPGQLREIADLEEARDAGTVTEGHYRRQLDKILAEAREESATSD